MITSSFLKSMIKAHWKRRQICTMSVAVFTFIYLVMIGVFKVSNNANEAKANHIAQKKSRVYFDQTDGSFSKQMNSIDNTNITGDSHPYIDEVNGENDYFIYHYKGEYSNATAEKALYISRHQRSHLGWQNIQFASMNLAVASNFVVVTAASSSYVRYMESVIGSAQRFLPNKTIIVYDIGMTKEQVTKVSLFSQSNLAEVIQP